MFRDSILKSGYIGNRLMQFDDYWLVTTDHSQHGKHFKQYFFLGAWNLMRYIFWKHLFPSFKWFLGMGRRGVWLFFSPVETMTGRLYGVSWYWVTLNGIWDWFKSELGQWHAAWHNHAFTLIIFITNRMLIERRPVGKCDLPC